METNAIFQTNKFPDLRPSGGKRLEFFGPMSCPRGVQLPLKLILLLMLPIGLMLGACSPSQAALDATNTQVEAKIIANKTAQAPSQTPTLTPTQTATATPTATPTATDTPTVTPTPTPWLNSAALRLEDLPAGFRPMSAEELHPLSGKLSSDNDVFGFINETSLETIFGILFPYPDRSGQLAFDKMIPQVIDLYANSFGAGDTSDQLSNLEDIGEAQDGVTFVSSMFGIPMRWEVLVFRRGEIGTFLFAYYPDGDEPDKHVVEVGKILDERFGQVLSSRR